ncbi:hypothetical protein F4805DRAFT_448758 [Annulohypoxylon moriforme]|nr:hypothetical protein F4805DRAFT_448758 [Annulohypoxylon moriforme]
MESDDDGFDGPVILSRQTGSLVGLIGPGVVSEQGIRVTNNQVLVFKLATEHIDVPVPTPYSSVFNIKITERNEAIY